MINCPLLNITVQKSNIVTISINPVMSLKKIYQGILINILNLMIWLLILSSSFHTFA